MINDKYQIVIRKSYVDGIGNVFKAFISALGLQDNVVVECNDNFMYGKYDTILDDKFIFKNDGGVNNEYFYTSRLLVQKSEEDGQQNIPNEFTGTDGCQNRNLNHLFSFSKLIDSNYDPNKVSDVIKNRVFESIDKIAFKDIVSNELKNFENTMINNRSENLAISVRTWKASHEHNINRPYHFNVYKNKITELLDNNKNIKNVILSIDNDSYLNDYIELFNSYDITLFVLSRKEYLNELQFAIIKVLLLSKCQHLVANRISTFSELIFWFSKCAIKVYPLF
jgi:hypothetical protein